MAGMNGKFRCSHLFVQKHFCHTSLRQLTRAFVLRYAFIYQWPSMLFNGRPFSTSLTRPGVAPGQASGGQGRARAERVRPPAPGAVCQQGPGQGAKQKNAGSK